MLKYTAEKDILFCIDIIAFSFDSLVINAVNAPNTLNIAQLTKDAANLSMESQ